MENLKEDLREVTKALKETNKTLVDFMIEMNGRVSKVEVKSGAWGFLGGLGAIAIVLGIGLVKASM